jgi:ABC-type sugar transport system ATPase subunit
LKLGIRPWGIRVSQTQTDGAVPGVVVVVEDLGDETRVGVRYGEVLIMSSIPVTRRYRPGLPVFLHFNDEDLNLFDPTTGERLSDGSYGSSQSAHETVGKNEVQASVSR